MEMKNYALLYCLDQLLLKHKIDKKEVVGKFKLAMPTFDRYKKRIREYLKEFHPEMRLVYRKRRDMYYILVDSPETK